MKLNLGCGHHFLPGYINMEYAHDFAEKPHKIELLGSGMELPLKSNSLEEILSFHVIEHMPRPKEIKTANKWRKNVDDFLQECYRTLKTGGKLVAECPDIEAILKDIVNNSNWYMIDHVFGLDRYPGDIHQWGYTKKSLKNLIKSHGFDNVKISEGTDYHNLSEPCLRVEATKLGLKRINIEPTSACNLECTFCTRDESKRPNVNMDLRLYRSIIDQLYNLGLFEIEIRYFLSGEPLVAGNNLIAMLKYANQLGFHNHLIHTNGTLLHKFGEGILKVGLKTISISVDGADKETYERIRVNSNFEETIQKIRQFLKQSESYETKVVIQTIIENGENREEYKIKMMELLPGADEYYVRYPHNWNTLNEITEVSEHTKRVKKCFPSEFLSIYADGRVPVCCADLNGDYIIADANKESIEDIWINKLGVIRDKMINGDSIPELCDKCERYFDRKTLKMNTSPEERLMKAEKLLESSEFNRARIIFEELIKENDHFLEAVNDLAVLEHLQGNNQKALELIQSILKKDPQNEIAVGNLEYINKAATE